MSDHSAAILFERHPRPDSSISMRSPVFMNTLGITHRSDAPCTRPARSPPCDLELMNFMLVLTLPIGRFAGAQFSYAPGCVALARGASRRLATFAGSGISRIETTLTALANTRYRAIGHDA